MLNRSRCSTSCATGTAPGGNYSCKHGSLNGSCRKRPPQRGLGVAQLEKMRLQEEERIIISQQKIMLHSTAMAARQHQQHQQQQYYQQVKPQLQPPDQPNQLQQEFSSNIPMIPHHDHNRNHQQLLLLHRSAGSHHPVLPPLHIFFPNKLSIDHCTNSTSPASSVLHNHSTHRQDDISVSPPVNQVDHAVLNSTPNHDGIMINHPVPFPSYHPDWPPANAKYNSPLPNSTISFSHQAVSQPQQQTKQQQQLQNMTTNVKLPVALISEPTRLILQQSTCTSSLPAADPIPRSVTQQQLDLSPSSSNWSICPQQSLPIADHHSWSSKPTTCTDTAAAADEIRLWPPAMLSMIPLQKRVCHQYQLQKDSPCPMGQLYSPPSCLGAALMELPSLQNSGCHEQQTMCSAWLPAVPGLEAADRDWSARLSMDLNAAALDQFIEAKEATLWKEGCPSLLMAPRPVPFSPQSTSSSNISSCKTAMATNWEDKGSLLSLGQYIPDHSSTVSSLYENKHIRSSDTGCLDDFLKLGPPISNETCTSFNLTMEHKQHDIQQPVTCGHKVCCQKQPCETSCHGRLKIIMAKRTPKDDLLTRSEPTVIDLELRLSLPRFIG